MSQAKIVLVDSDSIFRNRLKKCLEASGHRVITAGEGDEALTHCKEHRPDIALVDLGTAKPPAVDLVGYIHSYSHTTTIVVLTASGTVAQAVEAMKLGAADYIQKPVAPEAVELLCREILLRHSLREGGSADDFLNLAELARTRNARIETRMYLKSAMLRDLTRPEPRYLLGEFYENEGNVDQAVGYYYMALDAQSSFEPAREALIRLGHIHGDGETLRPSAARQDALFRGTQRADYQ
jgi:DNA-binding response OmpR family regulator